MKVQIGDTRDFRNLIDVMIMPVFMIHTCKWDEQNY